MILSFLAHFGRGKGRAGPPSFIHSSSWSTPSYFSLLLNSTKRVEKPWKPSQRKTAGFFPPSRRQLLGSGRQSSLGFQSYPIEKHPHIETVDLPSMTTTCFVAQGLTRELRFRLRTLAGRSLTGLGWQWQFVEDFYSTMSLNFIPNSWVNVFVMLIS